MMAQVTIYLDGVPERKERPQFARTKTGVRTFTRGKTRGYEARLKDAGEKAWPFAPMDCPIRLTVTAVFPITPSWPKWRRVLAALGKLWHVGRPDIDNVVKIAMDGLNEVIWKDDAQICWLVARKFHGPAPGLWLEVDMLDDTGGVAAPTGASAIEGDAQEG
jgi:Holliday junction resolvase RusA-like endonuclease